MTSIMKEMFGEEDNYILDDTEYESTFIDFDEDKNGTIDREEMANFIRQLAGLMPSDDD